jgi:hypothetical protein
VLQERLPTSCFGTLSNLSAIHRDLGVQNSTIEISENQGLGLERETGFEPATLSLGS